MKELSEEEREDLAIMVAKAKARVSKMSDEGKDDDSLDDQHCLAGQVELETD